MLIDIVILPPEKLRRRIGERIKKETKGYSTSFIVDNKKFIPHLSLWHLKTSKNRLIKVEAELGKLVKNQKPIRINSSKFHITKMKNGISTEFFVRKSSPMASLRDKVFRRTYRLKTGMVPPFKPFGIWSGKALKEAKKYGRPIGFGPHFTMAWLKNWEDALEVRKRMENMKFSFTAKEIYICRVNLWWQVDKIIKKINFSNVR